jgi:quercetin dioxygenase-like cupin family protein
MPKLAKDQVPARQQGADIFWAADLDGYNVNIVKVGGDVDLAPLLQGLPHDQCPSPHWGYVIAGRLWFRFGGTEETFEAGDAFFAPPGHTPGATEGAEFVIFSPADVMATVEAHMMKRAGELFGQ